MQNRLSAILILVTFFLQSCATVDKEKSELKAGYYLQIGTNHLINKNYPAALRELLNAERLDPNNPIILNNLGLAYSVREKFIEAEKKYIKALSIDNKYTDARNNLGRLYIDIGLYDKAIEVLLVATADLTFSQPEKSWANLGQAYFLKTEYSLAQEAFQKSLQTMKNNCFTMNYYGRSLFELKKYKQASESFDHAIKYCTTSNEEPQFYSALSLYKLGELDLARTRLNEIRSSYPNGVFAKKALELLEIMQ
jgi:type IV pilus assembly protein PilF